MGHGARAAVGILETAGRPLSAREFGERMWPASPARDIVRTAAGFLAKLATAGMASRQTDSRGRVTWTARKMGGKRNVTPIRERYPKALRPLLRGIVDLKSASVNPNRHTEPNLAAIGASLRRFGQVAPIVIRRGVVIAGNGTFEVAKAAGWKRIAAVDVGDVLSRTEARAFAIDDNAIARMATWDIERLIAALREAGDEDVKELQWQRDELEKMEAEARKGSIAPDGPAAMANVTAVKLFLDAAGVAEFHAREARLRSRYGTAAPRETVARALTEQLATGSRRNSADTRSKSSRSGRTRRTPASTAKGKSTRSRRR